MFSGASKTTSFRGNANLRPFSSITLTCDGTEATHETAGAFIFIGNGKGEGACDVHNPHYDFNDDIIPLGASFFARLIEKNLPKR